MIGKRIASSFLIGLILTGGFLSQAREAEAAGASLYLTPSTGTFVIGSTFKVGVRVNSGGEPINAAEGSLTYDSDLIEVASLSKGSVFMFWTTEPSSGGGRIRFGGGNPTSYTGSAGGVLTITFKAKKAGTAGLGFSSGAVLANDGKGTNILASMGSASYTIAPQIEAPVSEPKPKDKTGAVSPEKTAEAEKTGKEDRDEPVIEDEYNKPQIRSVSHPDQNTWYQSGDIELAWDLPKGVSGVSVSLDDKAISDPGPESDGLLTGKKFLATESGIWYAHVKFKDASRWGTIAHQRIMIDRTPPESFKVEVASETGKWPVISFGTIDKESGLSKYQVYVGSLEHQAHELAVDRKDIELSDLEPGQHTVLLKAIDKAGNQRVETVEFFIEAIPSPAISDYPGEVRPSDRFYAKGTAPAGGTVLIMIERDGNLVASSSTAVDAAGNWIYIHPEKLAEGHYTVFAEARNELGMRSQPSAKLDFLVSPPVFATIGTFILDYFTVIVSLIFMIVLVGLMIAYLIFFLRKKLKRETIEVEEVLKRNIGVFRQAIEGEFEEIIRKETRVSGRKSKTEAKERLLLKLETAEKKILKEVKDVEEILK